MSAQSEPKVGPRLVQDGPKPRPKVGQSQPRLAQVQSWLTKVRVRPKNIKFGLKWVENRPFGPKQRPDESYSLSGPIQTTPEAKNEQKTKFSNAPASGRRHPRTPFHRSPPVWPPSDSHNLTRESFHLPTVCSGQASLPSQSTLMAATSSACHCEEFFS